MHYHPAGSRTVTQHDTATLRYGRTSWDLSPRCSPCTGCRGCLTRTGESPAAPRRPPAASTPRTGTTSGPQQNALMCKTNRHINTRIDNRRHRNCTHAGSRARKGSAIGASEVPHYRRLCDHGGGGTQVSPVAADRDAKARRSGPRNLREKPQCRRSMYPSRETTRQHQLRQHRHSGWGWTLSGRGQESPLMHAQGGTIFASGALKNTHARECVHSQSQ